MNSYGNLFYMIYNAFSLLELNKRIPKYQCMIYREIQYKLAGSKTRQGEGNFLPSPWPHLYPHT